MQAITRRNVVPSCGEHRTFKAVSKLGLRGARGPAFLRASQTTHVAGKFWKIHAKAIDGGCKCVLNRGWNSNRVGKRNTKPPPTRFHQTESPLLGLPSRLYVKVELSSYWIGMQVSEYCDGIDGSQGGLLHRFRFVSGRMIE